MKTKANYTNSSWLFQRELKSLPLVEFAVESTSGVRNMDPRFFKYQKDPILFCKEILKEDFPQDIERLMMSVVDNRVSVAKSSNSYGKTYAAARIAIWFYKCFPGSKVFLAAAPPEDNLKRLLWGQIELLMLKHPTLFENDTPVSLMVSTDPEWYIKGLTIPSSGSPHEKVAKFSGKHAPYIMFILDEGDAIPDECYEGIETCMSGGHARMLIMFNPRNQSGPIYIKEQKGEGNFVVLSAFSHPNVVSGLDLIPGAVTREVTVARINKYTRPVVEGDDLSHSIFELPSFLVGQTAEADDKSTYPPLLPGLRKILESKFSYMVLGEYPAQTENQLISLSWVKRAQQKWMDYTAIHGDSYPQDTRPIMGLDVAEMGADYNVLCLRYGGYVPKMEFWSGMFPVQTGEKASRVYHLSSASKAFVDAMTVGTDVAPTMQKMGCTCIGVKVSTSPTRESDLGAFSQLRDQLYWSIREWLKDDSSDAMLPPDKLLEEELLSLTYEIPDGKIKVTPKPVLRNRLRRSPDRLDALALTFTQESDKLLHFYDNIAVCEYDRETASIIVKYDGNNIFETNTETLGNVDIISLSDMLDFGFVSTTKDFSCWSICRLWLSSSGKIILPEIWRVEHNDPRMVVEKVFESHKKRKFRSVGCHSELSKFLRPHWNDLENELYSFNEGLMTPELVSIKALDRTNRQLIIRDVVKMKGAGVLRNVIERKDIWGQFGHCESKPDDSRDALAGAMRLMLRET